MSELSNVQQALLKLRLSYLDDLPERCDLIEELVLKLQTDNDYQFVYQALYREIHSTKGSAGTHGIEIISTICHQFEELLNLIDAGAEQASHDIIDHLLKYNDLIRQVVEMEHSRVVDVDGVMHQLEKFHVHLFPDTYRCMIIDASSSRAELYKKAIGELPVNVTVMDNGYQALQPLLQEKYDILVTSKELPTLNGIALVKALRASGSLSRHVFTILLSVDAENDENYDKNIDCIIQKNTDMLDELVRVFKGYMAKNKDKDVRVAGRVK